MNISGTSGIVGLLLLAFSRHCLADNAPAESPAQPDLQTLMRQIEQDIAELRGLPFKAPVTAEMQSREGLAAYMDERIREVIPEVLNANYGAIVKRLGLYRGQLSNLKDVAKGVIGSQLAAYYDPKSQKFYVLFPDMPELLRNVTYAHELYHGLQDQYFSLDK